MFWLSAEKTHAENFVSVKVTFGFFVCRYFLSKTQTILWCCSSFRRCQQGCFFRLLPASRSVVSVSIMCDNQQSQERLPLGVPVKDRCPRSQDAWRLTEVVVKNPIVVLSLQVINPSDWPFHTVRLPEFVSELTHVTWSLRRDQPSTRIPLDR